MDLMRNAATTICLLIAVFLIGCEDGAVRSPQTSLTVINAAPSFESLSLSRGTTQASGIGTFEFGTISSVQLDSGTYNFRIETRSTTGSEPVERAAFSAAVEAEQNNLYVLAEQNGAVVPLRFSRPEFDQSGAEWELTVINAVESGPALSIELIPTGSGTPVPNQALPFGQQVAIGTLQPDTYEVVVSETGNSANILFRSEAATFSAGQSVDFVITTDRNGIENRLTLNVTLGDVALVLNDVTAPSLGRFLNGAADQLARDIFLDGDFTTPFVDDVAFAATGTFLDIPVGTSVLAVTPGDNASVVEAELTDQLQRGTPHNVLIAGTAGDISAAAIADNRRRFDSNGRLAILNTVSTYENLAIFVVNPGTDITTVAPDLVLTAPDAGPRTTFAPGAREITVVDAASANTVLGPLSITIADGGLYTVMLHESGDGTTVSALLLDDLQ